MKAAWPQNQDVERQTSNVKCQTRFEIEIHTCMASCAFVNANLKSDYVVHGTARETLLLLNTYTIHTLGNSCKIK